jgi:hypothetical protein
MTNFVWIFLGKYDTATASEKGILEMVLIHALTSTYPIL